MQQIEIYNWDPGKMCINKYCSSKQTHYEYVKINGMEIVVCLCEECSKKWEDYKKYNEN